MSVFFTRRGKAAQRVNFAEYIQSDGMQCIDTEFQPDQNTRVVIDIEATKAASVNFVPFGCRVASNNKDYSVWYSYNNRTTMYSSYGNASVTMTVPDNLARLKIDKNKNVTTINGVTGTNTAVTFSTGLNLFLFSLNANGKEDTSRRISAKLYSCQIYDNSTLVRNFRPCYDPDGVACLYDTVGAKYYYNKGSGNFVAGGAVMPQKCTIEITSITGSNLLDSLTINGTEYAMKDASLAGAKFSVDEGSVINIKAFTGAVFINGTLVAEGIGEYCYYDYVVSGNITISWENSAVYITEL